MLNEFVEKIIVHEAEGKRQGYGRTQKIEHKRTVWRANYHKNREKILAKKKLTEERMAVILPAKESINSAEVKGEEQMKREKKRAYQREWYRRRKQTTMEAVQKEAV